MDRIKVNYTQLDRDWRVTASEHEVEGSPSVGATVQTYDNFGNQCEGEIVAITKIYHVRLIEDTFSSSDVEALERSDEQSA